MVQREANPLGPGPPVQVFNIRIILSPPGAILSTHGDFRLFGELSPYPSSTLTQLKMRESEQARATWGIFYSYRAERGREVYVQCELLPSSQEPASAPQTQAFAWQ